MGTALLFMLLHHPTSSRPPEVYYTRSEIVSLFREAAMPFTTDAVGNTPCEHTLHTQLKQLSTHADIIPSTLSGSYNPTPEEGDRAPVTYPDY